MIITLDGPTASGKSALAAALAQKLHMYHLNSGLLYRSLAYLLVKMCGYTLKNLSEVQKKDIALCMNSHNFSYQYNVATHNICITYQDNEITPFLKDASVDSYVMIISSQALVREAMVKKQREIADMHDVVTDGRDVGSHVFVDADYKFYITASLNVRVERWIKDQKKRGNIFSFEAAKECIEKRDKSDETRLISPLIIPDGAYVIDSTNLSLQETVQKIYSIIINIMLQDHHQEVEQL